MFHDSGREFSTNIDLSGGNNLRHLSFLLCPIFVLVTQLYPVLCDPMGCSPPGSSVHGILQARMLERVAIPFSRESSWAKDRTWVSCNASNWATREAHVPFRPSQTTKSSSFSFLYLLVFLFNWNSKLFMVIFSPVSVNSQVKFLPVLVRSGPLGYLLLHVSHKETFSPHKRKTGLNSAAVVLCCCYLLLVKFLFFTRFLCQSIESQGK